MTVSIAEWLEVLHGSQFPAQELESARIKSSPSQLKRKYNEMEGHDTETPRRSFNPPLQLDLTPTAFNPAPTPSTSARRQSRSGRSYTGTRSSTASSATGSRCSSPTKRKRDLEFVRPRIIFQHRTSFVNSLARLEKNTALLQGLVEVVKDSQKALPRDLQTFVAAQTRNDFVTQTSTYSDDKALDSFQKLESKITRIVKTTEELIAEESHEDEWSESVVRLVLDVSRDRAKHKRDIKVISAKNVDVRPKTLLPTDQWGAPAQTKRVDHVFATDLPDIQTVRDAVARMPHQTLNQTDYGRLCYRVLFSHLEIKRPRDPRDADVQLGTWCAAGFKKLDEMRSQKDQGHGAGLAATPIWFVQAERWSLSIAIQESEEQISIFGPLLEWSTDQSDRVAFLIMTISNIMDWGWDQYRPWFMDHIAYNATPTLSETATQIDERSLFKDTV